MNKVKQTRVLVLDDDKFMLEFVSHLLRELGVNEVLVAEDGKAGLFVLSAQVAAIDLLICDIEMPGMDGIEFLRNIADQNYRGRIVLFSEINPDLLKATERLATARGLNIIGTLAKPVTVGSLAAILEQLASPALKSIDSSQMRQIFDVEEIKQALIADHIDLFYQPKVAVSSDHVTSVECLARWRHAEYGYVSPNSFIPVIEQYALYGTQRRPDFCAWCCGRSSHSRNA